MAQVKERYVGQSVKRKEDAELITGQGRYTEDISIPGMLWMSVVRSPCPPIAHTSSGLWNGAIVQKMEGWHPVFASGGHEALEMLAKSPPDVVLTDMLMPEMDGLQLVQEVRAKYPLTPVILMTAHGSEDIAIQALQKGAASYVPKKSLARDLGETVEQVINASRANRDQRRLIQYQTHFEATFVLENDPTLIPPLVGHLEDAFVVRLVLGVLESDCD